MIKALRQSGGGTTMQQPSIDSALPSVFTYLLEKMPRKYSDSCQFQNATSDAPVPRALGLSIGSGMEKTSAYSWVTSAFQLTQFDEQFCGSVNVNRVEADVSC